MFVDRVTGKVKVVTGVFTKASVVVSPDSEIDVYSNRGAAAQVIFVLPPAVPGMQYTFVAEAAQNIRLTPATGEQISLAGTLQSANTSITGTGAQNLVCTITCLTTGQWKDTYQRGTWA